MPDRPNLCATKLNKILFYADFLSFHDRQVPVTGEEYQRLERGPAPRRMVPVRREMVLNHDIVVRPAKYHGKTQHRVMALREPDLSIFSGTDIAVVDHVIEYLWGKTASEISAISHGPWWKACYDQDSIPYEYSHLSDAPITLADAERTRELALAHGWGE